ncbi:ABC transporter permease [Mangrovihabitans endophyticus]|nr:ABC transporter permease [Mangrovihabitans endophyticus]
MPMVAAVRLIAAREIRVKLRDKTFLFSTVFFLFIAVAATVLPSVLAGSPDSVAVADQVAATKLRDAGLTVHVVTDDDAAERQVRDGDADAAVVAGPQVLAMDDVPNSVVRALSVSPPVRLLNPDALDPVVAYMVPFALAFVFFLTAFTFGLQIAQGVTEEKQTRVVEILVSAVPVRALLAGKVAALTLLAFGQVAIVSLVALVGMQLAGVDAQVANLVQPTVAWFLPFFVLGFIMLATLWAGVGALAARQEDIGAASMPLQMVVMLPFFAVSFLSGNDTVMRVLSYFPPTAPTAMTIRIFHADTAPWEPILSLVVLAATAVATLAVGARIYEGSLLRTNGRTSFATAWRTRSTVA